MFNVTGVTFLCIFPTPDDTGRHRHGHQARLFAENAESGRGHPGGGKRNDAASQHGPPVPFGATAWAENPPVRTGIGDRR